MRAVLLMCVLSGCFGGQRNDDDEPNRPDAGIRPDSPPLADAGPDAPPDAPPGPPPEIRIVSPANNATIAEHQPVSIRIAMKNAAVTGFDLRVDGQPQSDFTISPTPTGTRCDACTFFVTWAALDVGESTHAIEVTALEGGPAVTGSVTWNFVDTPQILATVPTANHDLLGVGSVNVTATVLERGTATVAVAIDGVAFGEQTSSDCRGAGCQLAFPSWDTSTLAVGTHTVRFTVTDSHGARVIQTHTVRIDDLARVTSMHLAAGFVDESGTLEMEVYVFDNATNAFLGCAGSAHGMGPVNSPDIRYAIDARLVGPSSIPLRAADLGSKQLRFEVWEDDDNPVCPTLFDPNGNDFAGTAPVRTRAQWEASPTVMSFGSVVEMSVLFDRPISL
jgi:hypothetical protein